MFRIGFGYDQHIFTDGKKLILGGVHIEYNKGLLAHSDGDVLLHAVCDALLGALGRGDIGELFPDTDQQFKDADSSIFLRQIMKMIKREGYHIGNVDTLIFCDAPQITPYKKQIVERISGLLEIDTLQVNIKATRSEGMGSLSDEKGIAAQAVVLLIQSSIPEL